MKRIVQILAALLILPLTVTVAAAQDAYRIKSGDVLRIEVLEDSNLNREALVLPDGSISIPLAGTVQAGGLSIDQVRANVTDRLAPNFAAKPTVFVSLRSLGAAKSSGSYVAPKVRVYVMGEVGKPGVVELESGTTLLQALAQVGGFSKFAAKKRIQLRRTDKSNTEQVYKVNYDAILAGTSSIGTTVLSTGDIIVVPQRRLFE
ncbi:polysaccharide biosynthesis/export family protein [Actibacterium sp. XHP0104]|uniref:polysaccharide biosynthesis/export family protein n=1 Tax=Actibacterium sp. XHP0104 TaxID=2984335 RepID=UPI0021E81EFC|nr:polysaccharide biosynthesis/export family protein [Actibacterium sp. XHP0104]MCV2881848.1 polysaccharide export protein [Actibacterium sp. XHP0104]